jgi:hypothetical protein
MDVVDDVVHATDEMVGILTVKGGNEGAVKFVAQPSGDIVANVFNIPDLLVVLQPIGQIPLPYEFDQELRGQHKIVGCIIEQGEEG